MSFGKRRPAGYLGVERRRAVRMKMDGVGHVILRGGDMLKCRVRDISAIGACFTVASAFGLPETFELRVDGRSYHVGMVRRGTGHVGVTFV
jgi:hypothetical protein